MIDFKIIDGFLSKKECDELMEYSLSNLDLKVAKILTDDEPIVDSHRKSKISFDKYTQFNFLNEKITSLVSNTYSIHGHEIVYNDRGYQFTSYETGEYYNWHTDNSDGRYCSIVINLNDDYDGGRLELIENDKVITFNHGVGNAVIFLSEMNHRVTEILNGTRYSLVNWLKLKPLKEFKKTIL